MSFVLLTLSVTIGMIIGNMFSGGNIFTLVVDIVCEVFSHLTAWMITVVMLLLILGYHIQQVQHPLISLVF